MEESPNQESSQAKGKGIKMKRTTTLKGADGDMQYEVVIKSKSKSKPGKLKIHEFERNHKHLVEGVHKAMSDNGCYSQEIKVS